jgi:hypothetical protein
MVVALLLAPAVAKTNQVEGEEAHFVSSFILGQWLRGINYDLLQHSISLQSEMGFEGKEQASRERWLQLLGLNNKLSVQVPVKKIQVQEQVKLKIKLQVLPNQA